MTPEATHAAALAALPRMTPRRLRLLLDGRSPATAWHTIGGGVAPSSPALASLLADADLQHTWRRVATPQLLERIEQSCAAHAVQVLVRGQPGYPEVLAPDPAAPAVLFARGDVGVLASRRAAIVGTRNATNAGRTVAQQLGRELAEHGVAVVSGLARGIDAAAHRGCVAASGRPVAVVASGPDVVYPREHRPLWEQVAEQGLLLTEGPPGTPPEAHRFPLRNRILAALSEVVVVVESRATGGSLITAVEAAERGIPVMAVPGNVRSRVGEGVNDLLADGAAPVRDAADVLTALDLHHERRSSPPRRAAPGGLDGELLALLRDGPRCLGDLVQVTGHPVAEVALALGRLEAGSWVLTTDGWFELASPPTWPAC